MSAILPASVANLGDLRVPDAPQAVVVVVTGRSAEDDLVAEALHDARFATLTLTQRDADSTIPSGAHLRALTERLLSAADWLRGQQPLTGLPVGVFGTLAAGGAALTAAARRPEVFRALVLRDGSPHVPGVALRSVSAATLLIVDGHDDELVALNQETMARVIGIAELEILSAASVNGDDPGPSSHVARLARRWFDRFLS